MAKHKPVNRIIIAGLGIGVLIAVIVPVMIFVFGVGFSDVLPQNKNPAPLEIPFVCPQGNTLTAEGACIPNITPIIDDPEMFCQLSQSQLQQIAQCEVLTMDEQTVPLNTNLQQHQCNEIQRNSVLDCNKQVDQLIQKILTESKPVIQPIPPNGTQSSIDDTYTQICDQNPSLIICGKSRSLELLTRVLKTDSAGVQTTVETKFQIPFASLFVEDTSNIDFRKGKLQFESFVVGDPNFKYTGTGKVDLLIGTQSVFGQPLNVKVDGTANNNGQIKILFVSPAGQPSDLIFFEFDPNFAKFPNEATTKLRLNIIELNIKGERDQNFSIKNQDVFIMDIFRDDIKLLITDTEGIQSRVYPSDSRIIVTPKTSTSDPVMTGVTRIQDYQSIFYGNGLGCSLFQLVKDQSFTPNTATTGTVPAPNLGTITIKNSEGKVVTTSSGSIDYNKLTRNDNYTINLSAQNIKSSPLEYGKSQESKSFACTQKGKPDVKSYSITSGNTGACGYYTITSGISLSGTFTITPNSISCNFPQGSP